jgi:NMD protein affecting ribosome stability and mRNA decay
MASDEFSCPQCGENTPELYEGYCAECCAANQAELDEHNAQFDRWQRMTDKQREFEIKQAVRWGYLS